MKTKNIKKYLSKRSIKAKAGATLVELVAVVCILAIMSTTCIRTHKRYDFKTAFCLW